ncbi:hypothetical protein [Neorhizobium galegae]|uniref:hypothetical protein n=1 Tax=Neorhizobium galegae TaxID=399 RepID=UPI000621CA6C|nr:hypothetical protein [Neorhizobium galegae]CDZ53440.1 Hypothetical protein NGAL_HAMBI2427_51570 [Neorhizobium galegae bv. orientalis]
MCNSVLAEGREYSSPTELSKLIGGTGNLVWRDRNPFSNWPEGEDWHAMDLCLCPINLSATLDRAGLKWRRGTDDPMEFLVTAEP